jgi:HAE1 family hydrophobic/amphiphilic exporter-1
MSTNAGVHFCLPQGLGPEREHRQPAGGALNRDFFMGHQRGPGVCLRPPGHSRLGSGSGFTMMIQDRAGNTPQYLAEQRPESSFRRPGRVLKSVRRHHLPAQRAPALHGDQPRQGLKAGVALNDIYTTIGAFLGGSYVNDFNRFGRLYKAYVQAEPEYRISEDQHQPVLRQKQGTATACPCRLRQHQGGCRSRLHQPLQPLPVRGADRRTGPRIHLHPGPGRPGGGGRPGACPDMGYAWSNMSYQEKKGRSGSGGHRFCSFPWCSFS